MYTHESSLIGSTKGITQLDAISPKPLQEMPYKLLEF